MPELTTLLFGLLIFFARIIDVSLGTLRILTIVQGRTFLSFLLGFFEIAIWLTVVSSLFQKVHEEPILILFYSLGFATGNIAGIKLEQHLALGHTALRLFSRQDSAFLSESIRAEGYPVTVFTGEGLKGEVHELYVVCKRKNLPRLLEIIKTLDSDAFFTTESVGTVNRLFSPPVPFTGWRARIKKK